MANRIIFLDTETTGLCPDYERIVEIAAIEVNQNYQPKKIFHEYLDPLKSVGSSYRIHGLSDQFLHGRRTFEDIADDFVQFINGATVYAHNLSFDQRFINSELQRCGLDNLEDYANPIDTLPLARRIVHGRASLDALIDLFDIDGSARDEYHGALIDAELLLKVFLCLNGKKEAARLINCDALNDKDAHYQDSLSKERKMIDETDYDPDEISFDESDDYRYKLEAIIEFSDDNSWFDGSMYEDMLYQLDEKDFLTDRQKEVIDKIYAQFC